MSNLRKEQGKKDEMSSDQNNESMSPSSSYSSSDNETKTISSSSSGELEKQVNSKRRVTKKKDDTFGFQPTKNFKANVRQAPKGIDKQNLSCVKNVDSILTRITYSNSKLNFSSFENEVAENQSTPNRNFINENIKDQFDFAIPTDQLINTSFTLDNENNEDISFKPHEQSANLSNISYQNENVPIRNQELNNLDLRTEMLNVKTTDQHSKCSELIDNSPSNSKKGSVEIDYSKTTSTFTSKNDQTLDGYQKKNTEPSGNRLPFQNMRMRISKSKEQLKNILADTISHLSGIFTENRAATEKQNKEILDLKNRALNLDQQIESEVLPAKKPAKKEYELNITKKSLRSYSKNNAIITGNEKNVSSSDQRDKVIREMLSNENTSVKNCSKIAIVKILDANKTINSDKIQKSVLNDTSQLSEAIPNQNLIKSNKKIISSNSACNIGKLDLGKGWDDDLEMDSAEQDSIMSLDSDKTSVEVASILKKYDNSDLLPKIKLNKTISFSKKKSTDEIKFITSNIEIIDQLNFEIEKMNLEATELKRKLDIQLKINSTLNTENINLQDEVDIKSEKIAILNKENESKDASRNGLQNALEASNKKCVEMKNEFQAQLDIERLAAKSKVDELEKIKAELNDVKRSVIQKSEELQKLELEKNKLKQSNSALMKLSRENINGINGSVSNANKNQNSHVSDQSFKELEKEIELFKKALETKESELNSAKDQLEKQNSKQQDSDQSFKELKNEFDQLKRNLEKKENEHQTEVNTLKNQISELEKKSQHSIKSEQNIVLKSFEKQFNQLKKSLETKENELSSTRNQLNEKINSHLESDQILVDLTTKFKKLNETLHTKEQEFNKLSNKNSEIEALLQTKEHEHQTEVSNLKNKISELEKISQIKNVNIKSEQCDCERKKEIINYYQKQIQEHEHNLKQKDNEINSIRENLKEANISHELSDQSSKELEKNLNVLNQTLEAKENELNLTRNKLEKSDQEINELKKNLEKHQNELDSLIYNANNKLNEANEYIKDLQNQKIKNLKNLENIESKLSRANYEVNTTKMKNEKLKLDLIMLEQEKKKLLKEYENNLERNKTDYEQNIINLNKENEKKLLEFKKTTDQQQIKFDSKYKEYNLATANFENEKNDLFEENRKLQKNLNELTNNYKTSQIELDNLKNTFKNYKNSKETTNNQCALFEKCQGKGNTDDSKKTHRSIKNCPWNAALYKLEEYDRKVNQEKNDLKASLDQAIQENNNLRALLNQNQNELNQKLEKANYDFRLTLNNLSLDYVSKIAELEKNLSEADQNNRNLQSQIDCLKHIKTEKKEDLYDESENEEEIDGDDIDGDDDDESTDHSEESVDMLEDDTTNIIYEYSNSQYNNNYGHCAYCDRKNLKNVSGHIGHMHKCKNCKNLIFKCNCKKEKIVKNIIKHQKNLFKKDKFKYLIKSY